MTSDTKIGLLLGLLFIFVIAFLINGLPSFKDMGNDGNELLAMSMDTNVPGLGQREQHARALLPGLTSSAEAAETTQEWPLNAHNRTTEPPRTVMDLSGANQLHVSQESLPLSVLSPVAQQNREVARAVLEQQQTAQPMQRPKIHTVKEGETLATIAKLVYGPQQGNRRQVVQQLFEANRKDLKSPDCIYVGQKLIIPALPGGNEVISAGTFIPVPSSATPALPQVNKNESHWYKVEEGDSLWKIANRQLGDGNRYTDIVSLNRDVLGDEDEISVGMRLRLPSNH